MGFTRTFDNISKFIGRVVSTKNAKTVKVAVPRFTYIKKYQKTIQKTKNFMAHDENEECVVGDLVMIQHSKSYSATKRFRVVEIIEKNPEYVAALAEKGVQLNKFLRPHQLKKLQELEQQAQQQQQQQQYTNRDMDTNDAAV
eukprot:GEZU01004928.1.p1 GENE.GEZU01004928.1~~GEZU01004928.1.p1  ORF type:complete len:152 (-),score=51.27 GEZU01004928.1:27-452(-)